MEKEGSSSDTAIHTSHTSGNKKLPEHIKAPLIVLILSMLIVFSIFVFIKYQYPGRNSESAKPFQIEESLLAEEAERQDIEVSDKEVDDFVDKSLEAAAMSKGDFEKELQDYGLSYEQYRETVKQKIAISELIAKNVDLESVKVSDKEVDGYIDDYRAEFQDIIDDADTLPAFRERVRFQLLKDKQTKLVSDFVSKIN